MDSLQNNRFFNSSETIAKELIDIYDFPWEILPEIHNFIITVGDSLPKDRFNKIGNDIWIAKTAFVSKTAEICGPVIIDENAEIRHCAFIRGNAIIGRNTVVGNSTELKNVILFNGVQVPHYNYVGDSILGYKAHMGAGAITSNVKSDHSNVTVSYGNDKINTNLRKMGAILGDFVEVGCNTVLNPGTVVGKNTIIYPRSVVRGYVSDQSIYKNEDTIVKRI